MSQLNTIIDNLKSKVNIPVIAAPMFLVSNQKTVISGCKAGIISSFPSLNARTVEKFEEWMITIKEELDADPNAAPWAVNIIVHKTNKRYKADLKLVQKYKPPIVITSLGDPTETIEIVHHYGGIVLSDVSTIKHAKKICEAKGDGLILVCTGAGGHGGTLNPFAFVKEVKEFWDGLLILAGGMTSGEDIVAAQAMGAHFAYLGTRFIAANESSAPVDYKTMLIESTIEDIIYTDAFTGVNGNYLTPSIEKAGLNPEKLIRKESIDFSELKEGTKAWKDIWSAGQGVGRTKQVQSMKEIVDELKEEYNQTRTNIHNY